VVNNSEKRVPGIDVLRGLCIIAVVLHHINLRIRLQNTPVGHLLSPATHRVLFWSGYYGVRVFFVISGFLIAGWSLKRWGSLEKVSLRQFYAMRFARIVPCLVGLLALLAFLDRIGAPRFVVNTQHTSLARALLAALTFHVNWLEAKTGYLPGAWDVLWSLSVEEVFYLFFPLVCLWLRKEVLLISLLGGFVILGPFARTVLTHNDLWADYGYLACMDGIALGCLAAIVAGKFKFGHKTNLALWISGAAFSVFVVIFRGTPVRLLGLYKPGLDVTLLELGTALLVIAFQQRFETHPTAGHWSTSPLRWFGRNSYEVYLTHMLVIWPMVGIFYHSHQSLNMAPWWFIAITILTGLLGYAVARWYSEPVNRALRTKLLPAKRVAAVGASPTT
jgi:peptidoglycan/LPS O-acetylase OafA/YrhL